MELVIGLLVFNFAFSSAYPFDEVLKSDHEKYGYGHLSEFVFDQTLDHNSNIKEKWKQHFWHESLDQKPRTVALLFILDDYTISEMNTIDNQFLNPLAGKLNAARFYLEHRFYGKSKPRPDTSLASLNYLNTDQALADIANFIKYISGESEYSVSETTTWMVAGISYGGTLAAWARYKYPNLIENAVAINAPLLAKVDYGEYFENVVNSLNSYNPKCGDRIKNANAELKIMIENKNFEKVEEKFRLCDRMTENDDDISTLFFELAKNVAYAVDTRIIKKSNSRMNVSTVCDIMLNSAVFALDSYAKVNRLKTSDRWDSERKCFDYRYENIVTQLKEVNNYKTINHRPRLYQICNEFGHFTSSKQTSNIFGDYFPVTYLSKFCQKIFEPEFNIKHIEEKAAEINKKYGGLEIDVNQTLFAYFPKDPWRNLFITTEKNDSSYKVLPLNETIYNQNWQDVSGLYGWWKSVVNACSCFIGGHNCLHYTSIDYSEHKNIY